MILGWFLKIFLSNILFWYYFDFISNIWNVRLTLVLSNSKRKGNKELWAKINTTTTTTCLGNICERGKNKQIASSHNRNLRKLYKHKFINISYNLSIDGSRLKHKPKSERRRKLDWYYWMRKTEKWRKVFSNCLDLKKVLPSFPQEKFSFLRKNEPIITKSSN